VFEGPKPKEVDNMDIVRLEVSTTLSTKRRQNNEFETRNKNRNIRECTRV
jgi:hypothetical protein